LRAGQPQRWASKQKKCPAGSCSSQCRVWHPLACNVRGPTGNPKRRVGDNDPLPHKPGEHGRDRDLNPIGGVGRVACDHVHDCDDAVQIPSRESVDIPSRADATPAQAIPADRHGSIAAVPNERSQNRFVALKTRALKRRGAGLIARAPALTLARSEPCFRPNAAASKPLHGQRAAPMACDAYRVASRPGPRRGFGILSPPAPRGFTVGPGHT
jgi:hypothetical protein